MKIAFVTSHYENLGIEYLSSYLKKNGYNNIKLFFEPALFNNFFFKSNFLYKNFFNYFEIIINNIKRYSPDIVAFSVISDNYSWCCKIAREIKKVNKNTIIVFGGIHPSSVPDYVLNDKICDYIVIGEGEEAFFELIEHLKNGKDVSKIKNIGGILKNNIFINEPRPLINNLDTLPFPDKNLFYSEYPNMVRKSYTILGTRGCIFECSYCWNSVIKKLYTKNFFRRRSIENIIKELKEAKERFKIEKVTFYDEIFTLSKDWLKDFLYQYKKDIFLPYFCCIHPDYVDEEIIELLEDSNCVSVNIGIQTTTEKLSQVINRKISKESIIRALSILRKSKVYVYSNFIVGLPTQTLKDLEEDFLFSCKYKSDASVIYWLRYYPKTDIIKIAENYKILSNEHIERINKSNDYEPYAIKGNTFNKDHSRLANLIIISKFIPFKIGKIIIKNKLYKYLPSKNLLFPALLILALFSNIAEKKRKVFHYFNLLDYISYYIHYSIRKVFIKFRQRR